MTADSNDLPPLTLMQRHALDKFEIAARHAKAAGMTYAEVRELLNQAYGQTGEVPLAAVVRQERGGI